MTTKERILSILLAEKLAVLPVLAISLGVTISSVSNKQALPPICEIAPRGVGKGGIDKSTK